MKTIVALSLVLFALTGLLFGVEALYKGTKEEQDPSTVFQQTNLPLKESHLQSDDSLKLLIEKTPPRLLKGFDWSLPAYANIEPYSGLVGEHNHSRLAINNKFIIVLWNQTNPRPGVFDFSRFDRQLRQLGDKKTLVRLEVNSSCEAPAWAMQKLRDSSDKSLIFWDENYISLLRPYIQEFAKRYANSPQIAGVQLGIGDGDFTGPCNDYDNKDGWGEFWMSPQALAEAQQNFGLTPQLFEARSKEIINIYANAFAGNRNKLAYTNLGPLFSWGSAAGPYNKRLTKLAHYALKIGLGTRDGGTETWMRFTDRIYGNYLNSMPDGSCRLDFDENYAKKIRGRYWGTENEFYGNAGFVLDRHGPYQNQPYRFLVSSLRSIQMRRNFISVSNGSMAVLDHPVYKTQQFLHYLNRVLGKQIENTPDAFVLLGERYITAFRAADHRNQACVKNNGDKIPVRSFGRWLTDTSTSLPALKTVMPASENYWDQGYYLPDGVDYEYFARKAKGFNFNLNDSLSQKRCQPTCEVEIKVTFKDTKKTSLSIEVEEGRSQKLQTSGDNQIKTATFRLHSRFKNKLSGSDIILKSNLSEIPVILLRVIFL